MQSHVTDKMFSLAGTCTKLILDAIDPSFPRSWALHVWKFGNSDGNSIATFFTTHLFSQPFNFKFFGLCYTRTVYFVLTLYFTLKINWTGKYDRNQINFTCQRVVMPLLFDVQSNMISNGFYL